MKEFFSKVKTWIITHKVVSVVIAAVLVAGVTLAIVLPVTLGGKLIPQPIPKARTNTK